MSAAQDHSEAQSYRASSGCAATALSFRHLCLHSTLLSLKLCRSSRGSTSKQPFEINTSALNGHVVILGRF
jgi:hypothetical protein